MTFGTTRGSWWSVARAANTWLGTAVREYIMRTATWWLAAIASMTVVNVVLSLARSHARLYFGLYSFRFFITATSDPGFAGRVVGTLAALGAAVVFAVLWRQASNRLPWPFLVGFILYGIDFLNAVRSTYRIAIAVQALGTLFLAVAWVTALWSTRHAAAATARGKSPDSPPPVATTPAMSSETPATGTLSSARQDQPRGSAPTPQGWVRGGAGLLGVIAGISAFHIAQVLGRSPSVSGGGLVAVETLMALYSASTSVGAQIGWLMSAVALVVAFASLIYHLLRGRSWPLVVGAIILTMDSAPYAAIGQWIAVVTHAVCVFWLLRGYAVMLELEDLLPASAEVAGAGGVRERASLLADWPGFRKRLSPRVNPEVPSGQAAHESAPDADDAGVATSGAIE